MKPVYLSFIFLGLITDVSTGWGATLKQAEITQIINEVAVIQPGKGERTAVVRDVVQGKTGVRTGQKSRAELVFADQTLTRLGANTIFNFEEGTRNLDLQQGVILLQVPKNAGGATIRTAAVTAAITGTTILFEHTPASELPQKFLKKAEKEDGPTHGYIKILVLEGTLRVWLKGVVGESILLKAGQMLVMPDDGTSIPDPVDFDVKKVVETSKLINDADWPIKKRLFQSDLIEVEIANQQKLKEEGDLLETNLFIQGRGTLVELGNDTEQRDRRRDAAPEIVQEEPQPPSTPDEPDDRDAGEQPGRPDPVREPGLEQFTFIGSEEFFQSESIPQFDPEFAGNATTLEILPDTSGEPEVLRVMGQRFGVLADGGGTDVLPTMGKRFDLISTGGNVENGNPLTATRGTAVVAPTAQTSQKKSFVEFDYRFLTDEGDRGEGNDLFTLSITGENGDNITYTFDKNLVVPEGQDQNFGEENVSALARKNVGGFFAGTDWLTLKLEVTPLLQQGNTTFILQINDADDADFTSAVAIDRYQITQESLVAPNSDLPGTLSLDFNGPITLGEGPGEYRVPSFRGRENTQPTGPGSDGGKFFVRSKGNIVVNADILADTGPNKLSSTDDAPYGGRGGSVDLDSGGKVTINRKILVSSNDPTPAVANPGNTRVSQRGGDISISGRGTGDAVEISNTGQLLALLNASSPDQTGSIRISTSQGNVLVNGGRIIADRGLVDVRSYGPNSVFSFNNAQVRADVVKIGALGTNGSLLIGGGNISADTTLKLYAGGSNGSITFVNDTTLGGSNAEKILAADRVTVQNGVNVNVVGRVADVYTNTPNYSGSGGNGSTTGRFNGEGRGGDGAVTRPFSSPAPPSFD